MADQTRPRIWEPILTTTEDGEMVPYGRRIYLPESGGWLLHLYDDRRPGFHRNPQFLADPVFVPSLVAWRHAPETKGRLALDFGQATHSPQPRPRSN